MWRGDGVKVYVYVLGFGRLILVEGRIGCIASDLLHACII